MGAGNYIWGIYHGHYSWNTSRFIGGTMTGALTGGYFSWGARIASAGSAIGSLVWRANGRGLGYIWNR